MADLPGPDVYRFGSVEVRLRSREMVGEGGHATFEPRVFDLLLYLIEHRSRVVTKQELLEKVWKTSFVSESVLSRAVMKLRRAFADVGGDPESIKTLHRVGYRFAGIPNVGAAPATPAAGPSRLPTETLRLAILPFDNETGDPLLAWVELGLLTIVSRSMAAPHALVVVPVEMMLPALALAPDNASIQEKVAVIGDALGIQRVAHVVVRNSEEGAYCLRWHLYTPDEGELSGELIGPLLTTLANQCGVELIEALLPEKPQLRKPALSRDEEFAAAAHGRALQAHAHQEYATAAMLMKVCVDIVPHPIRVDVDYALMLQPVDPVAGGKLARELVSKVSAASDPSAHASLLAAIADSAMRALNWAECEAICDQAESLLDAEADYEVYRIFRFFRFTIAFVRGEINGARAVARGWVARARNANDQIDLCYAMTSLAKLEIQRGDWDSAQVAIQEAIGLCRTYRLWATLYANLSVLGEAYMMRGRLAEAQALYEEGGACLERSGFGGESTNLLRGLYAIHSDMGHTEEANDQVTRMREVTADASMKFADGGALVDAQMRFGSVDDAAAAATEAISHLRAVPELNSTMAVYLTAITASGQLGTARTLFSELNEAYQQPDPSNARVQYVMATAQLAYRERRDEQVHALMTEYVALRGGLVTSFKGCTDLLWVTLDLGRIEAAVQIADHITDHLQQSLRGQVALARLRFERKQFDQAVALQKAALELAHGRRMRPYLEELLTHYESAVASKVALAIPRAPLLPSAF